MKWTPRDIIVVMMVAAIILYPIVTMISVAISGRPLTEVAVSGIEQILIALVAVISGYVVGRNGN